MDAQLKWKKPITRGRALSCMPGRSRNGVLTRNNPLKVKLTVATLSMFSCLYWTDTCGRTDGDFVFPIRVKWLHVLPALDWNEAFSPIKTFLRQANGPRRILDVFFSHICSETKEFLVLKIFLSRLNLSTYSSRVLGKRIVSREVICDLITLVHPLTMPVYPEEKSNRKTVTPRTLTFHLCSFAASDVNALRILPTYTYNTAVPALPW